MMSFLANHLWQSTLFTAAVWLLTLALRRNSARVRHGLWLAASAKFLIPFSLLITAGTRVPSAHTAPPPPQITKAVARVSEPFTIPVPAFHIPVTNRPSPVLPVIWLCGSAAVFAFWFVRWRRVREMVRGASSLDLGAPIRTLSSPALPEPGVFGIFRPVLLLPEGIEQRLSAAQLRAIIAHELCHVRRRDNLAATLHMLVEALFWFHPLVWWIGARLVDERERACDEAVLNEGSEPQAYAEGILNVCRLYLESPLPCVAGVTGADLRKRIEAIMTTRIGVRLSAGKKSILAVAALLAVAVPLFIGVIRGQGPRLQFEVATIKLNKGTDDGTYIRPSPGRLTLTNYTLRHLIAAAYEIQDFQVSGGPAWVASEHYDIEAKTDTSATVEQKERRMLQSLLEDRFQLKIPSGNQDASHLRPDGRQNGTETRGIQGLHQSGPQQSLAAPAARSAECLRLPRYGKRHA